MSEKESYNPELEKSKPNLLRDFEQCVEVVVQIESQWSSEISPQDKSIIRSQMGNALGALQERLADSKDDPKMGNSVVTGFQGLSGFNRYQVRRDGTIGLKQSHSTRACIKKAQELGVETPEF